MQEPDFLYLIENGFNVKRFHTEPLIREDTVGHHSAGVAGIIFWLYGKNKPSIELIEAALFHDIAEYSTGDTPAQAKWVNPDLHRELYRTEDAIWQELNRLPPHKALDTDGEFVLMYADNMECVKKVLHEMEMGNTRICFVAERIFEKVKERRIIQKLDSQIQERAFELLSHYEWRFRNASK